MDRQQPLPRGPVPQRQLRVVELFAGVGGFRLGLEQGKLDRKGRYAPSPKSPWRVVWSNQWEPSTKRQHASDIYEARFGPEGHSNEDINTVPPEDVPDHDLLVGGFPCQDYSVARVLNQAAGLRGKKGVLWWAIQSILAEKQPGMILLENVDRLLKSPAHQRGRDFAIILASLADLGYMVEWRVVNAADYGFPQRRRRVFIVGIRVGSEPPEIDHDEWLQRDGVLAHALPTLGAKRPAAATLPIPLPKGLEAVSRDFGFQVTPFRNAGLMIGDHVWSYDLEPRPARNPKVLADILQPEDEVDEAFFIPKQQLRAWEWLKGSKREPRVHKASGATYIYSEGAIPFPDPTNRPSRTILTGEGGTSPSRFKHVIRTDSGRLRRLTPIELERLNGFPDRWTEHPGVTEGRRAFLMGNALMVGIVAQIGVSIGRTGRQDAAREGLGRAEGLVR